jgi:prepilin-type N-terminal cleavage/methylation domain-containing protein
MRVVWPGRGGFTLLEVLVVLIVMGIAVALVAPALLPRKQTQSALDSLIPTAREAAARRGEIVYLRVAESGQWRLEGAASSSAAPLASGRVDPFRGLPLTIIVSPVGSCAFDLQSTAAARVVRLDPLTCRVDTR